MSIARNTKRFGASNGQRRGSTLRRLGGKGSVRPRNSPNDTPFLIRNRYPGLDAVLQEMKNLVKQYKGHPKIRDWAVKITQGIPRDIRTGLPDRRNYQNIADAIYQWMKRNVAYVRDPDDIEWLQSPVKTLEKRKGLQYGYGDCDDQTVAAAALMSAIGIPTRFKVVKADPQKPQAYSHVYLEYKADGEWRPFDPTLHTKAGDGLKDNQIFESRHVELSDSGGLSDGQKTNLKATGVVLLAGALAFSYWKRRNRQS